MSQKIAVIIGAGPGLGAALARAFAPTHSLLLISRSLPGSLPKLDLSDVADDRILALASDGTRGTLKQAIDEMKKRWPDGKVDVAISNAGGNYNPGSFLDMDEEMFRGNFEAVTCVISRVSKYHRLCVYRQQMKERRTSRIRARTCLCIEYRRDS